MQQPPLAADVIAYQRENAFLVRLLYGVAALCFVVPVLVYARSLGWAAVTAPVLLVPALVVGAAALSLLPAVLNKGMDGGERRLELAAVAFIWFPAATTFAVYRILAGGCPVAAAHAPFTWTAPLAALGFGLVGMLATRLR